MERLSDEAIEIVNNLHTERLDYYTEYIPLINALNKFADYEDAEENGMLIRLPCKVGDTVYKVWYKPCHQGENYPSNMNCDGCYDECDIQKAIFEVQVPNQRFILENFVIINNNPVYFLFREEAEKALKERDINNG